MTSTPGLVWTRAERPFGRGRPPRVSLDDLATSAIALLDRTGVDALTMRALASELDVAVGTVYGYVATKQELLDVVCDAVLGDLSPLGGADAAADGWRVALRRYLDELRDLCLAHPWWPTTYADRPAIGPQGLRHSEAVLEFLARLGVPLSERDAVMTTIYRVTIGHAVFDSAWDRWMHRNPVDVQHVRDYVAHASRALPAVHELTTGYLADSDPESARTARWETARETCLDGLAARFRR